MGFRMIMSILSGLLGLLVNGAIFGAGVWMYRKYKWRKDMKVWSIILMVLGGLSFIKQLFQFFRMFSISLLSGAAVIGGAYGPASVFVAGRYGSEYVICSMLGALFLIAWAVAALLTFWNFGRRK